MSEKDQDETQAIPTEKGKIEQLEKFGRAVAAARDAYQTQRDDGRKLVDQAWGPSIESLDRQLAFLQDALGDRTNGIEIVEALTRQLCLVAESLGRCRAARVTGYAQADAQALANLRLVQPPQGQPGQPAPERLTDRINAAARGFGRIPVVPNGGKGEQS
jgi:hypothetical protein